MHDADAKSTDEVGSQVRECPTHPGNIRPLIAHNIAVSLCLSRQRDFYHKCHRCLYRGKAVDYVVDEAAPRAAGGMGA